MLVNIIFSIYIKATHSWIIILIKYAVSRVNNIGVDIDTLLLFDKHVDRIVAKAYSRKGLL